MFSPDDFYFDLTILTVAMLVVGGIGRSAGTIVGTLVIASIAEMFLRIEAGTAVGPIHLNVTTGSEETVLAPLLLVMLPTRTAGRLARSSRTARCRHKGS